MAHRVFSKELDFGELIKESFSLFKKNYLLLILFYLIFNFPIDYFVSSNKISELNIAIDSSIITKILIGTLFSLIGLFAILKIIHNSIFEDKLNYKEILKFSLQRYFPGLISLIIFLMIIAFAIFPLIVPLLLLFLKIDSGLNSTILIAVSVLVIVPGIMFFVYYSFAFWVVVLREFNNTYEAMKYSKKLVKDKFKKTFAYLLMIFIFFIISYLLIEGVSLAITQNNYIFSSIIKGILSSIYTTIFMSFIYLLMINYEAEKGYFVEEGKEEKSNK